MDNKEGVSVKSKVGDTVAREQTGKTKNTRNRHENAVLIGVLVVLIVVIVGLVVGLVFSGRFGEVKGGGESAEQGAQTQEVGGELALGEDEEINAKIAELQEQIEAAGDDETKANLYWERIDYIWGAAGTEAYQEQVIRDAIAADELKQSSSSAFQVVNVAVIYGDEALEEEYNQKANERLAAEGVDLSTEGAGSDRTGEDE